jgi:hypothetical protein
MSIAAVCNLFRRVAVHVICCFSLSCCCGWWVCATPTQPVQHRHVRWLFDRVNTRKQACTYVFEVLQPHCVQLRLFAIYSGYCCMHRVCAACLQTRYSPRSKQTDATHSNRVLMSASMLDSLSRLRSCLLLSAGVALLLPAQGLYQAMLQYSLQGMFDRANTRKQTCIFRHTCTALCNSGSSAACRRLF